MVNGAGTVYIERDGLVQSSPARFTDEEHLRRTIDRIVARVGRRIDEASPMVDATTGWLQGQRGRATDRDRRHDLTIRKFNRRALSMDDLIGLGCLSREAAGLLAMRGRRLNILVSGGTDRARRHPIIGYMKTAAIYARISDARDGDTAGVDRQVKDCQGTR